MPWLKPGFVSSPVRQVMRTHRWNPSWQGLCPMIRTLCAAIMERAMYAAVMDTMKKAITAEAAGVTAIMAAEAITERGMKEAAATVIEKLRKSWPFGVSFVRKRGLPPKRQALSHTYVFYFNNACMESAMEVSIR